MFVIEHEGKLTLANSGTVSTSEGTDSQPCRAVIPAVQAEDLGDAGFKQCYGTHLAYMGGAMANGISSPAMVIALTRAGALGSYGSGGMSMAAIEDAIKTIQQAIGDKPFAVNLLHQPGNPDNELALVELLLKYGVRVLEASAFLTLSPAIIYYRLSGLGTSAEGKTIVRNRIIAKISRPELATLFMQPADPKMVAELLASGLINHEQAQLAKHIPVADDITVEADSGGHTDNRPLIALLPAIIALRDRLQEQYGYPQTVRIGAGGGISTPQAALAAFQMGAAYIVTGSINQACVESGTSERVRQLLAQADMADVVMAPSADMFEMGVKVQVLKKGTMFPMNAQKLYELYRSYPSLDAIPAEERLKLEKRILRKTCDEVWVDVQAFFGRLDPKQLQKAALDPKHKMALIFRWYLGKSSGWAIGDVPDRHMDMQIWCGPAMGAFNAWVKDSCLESPENRQVADVARHIVDGAAYLYRINLLRQTGFKMTNIRENYVPQPR
ncbi:PfaD family polyunsaturated fatty acid/polyketide biosynthesis protein [Gynuella sunshinyii]|uniref:Dioxygenases-like 2-nitropropane dioxygenase n=1 Tax=Gynuella sunshinyii YC6258 TaxID=1445510 RepID=A0A0C5W1V8_9GAMM|nr:PfaD family polyunsaturated fatty acid/polyketide biosynthesis protein [Gynuella sunshinyii]AJQ96659.1 dioxygenases-like 2-nitropropane dioxygenase [Gynuella sunshinyii YC6258]